MSISCLKAGITADNFTTGLSDNPTISIVDLSGIATSTVAKPLLSYTSKTSTRYATDTNKDMLDDTALTSIIDNITAAKIIPEIPANATRADKDNFDEAQKKLKNNIKAEYEFYYCRYIYCLDNLFINIGLSATANYTNGTESYKNSINDTIQKYLDYTKQYNQKLNDLIRIINKLNITISSNNTKTTQTLTTSDAELDKLIAALKEHNDKLSGKNTVANLRKDMVKYTEEKGRYTDNLLKMYSVLNIVALGLLVYVYKSAS